jgi:hypothetical protein
VALKDLIPGAYSAEESLTFEGQPVAQLAGSLAQAAVQNWIDRAIELGVLTEGDVTKVDNVLRGEVRKRLEDHNAEHVANGEEPCRTQEEIDQIVEG